MRKIAVFGANSAIAEAFARVAVERGDALFLVGRSEAKLSALKADLEVRGAKRIFSEIADLDQVDQHEGLLRTAQERLGGLDAVLIAHGVLGNESLAQKSYKEAEKVFRTNFLSAVSLCTLVAGAFEKSRAGSIAVISSVAGDRGRQSNYIYGASKGALSIFLEGLRNRLAPAGVQVLTVKPGFVDTPMTAQFPKGPLWATPSAVGKGIYRAIDRRKDIVYLPFFWWGIMTIIRLIPERIFKRLKL